MLRQLVYVLMTVVALACMVVGSTLVWPDIARSTASQALMTKADFDQVFASVNGPRSEYAPAILTKVDFERIFASVTGPRSRYAPASLTRVDFDQVFASVARRPQRDNTPPNREKLRNAGWKRIL